MTETLLASVIIINCNYERFLKEAIDSALAQIYPALEVIVVDDGSTDGSRAIIADYGSRVVPVLKENGGMASGFNAGFAASRGGVILFLDSDDVLLPNAVANAVRRHTGAHLSKVHWPLAIIDAYGQRTGQVVPAQALPEGDLREAMIEQGPRSHPVSPTSGNAWSRQFLAQVLPMPEPEFRRASDSYLYTLASVFGPVGRIDAPQSCYRHHGTNDFAGRPLLEQQSLELEVYRHRCVALSKYLQVMGIDRTPGIWIDDNAWYQWTERLYLSLCEIRDIVPPGQTFILVDECHWGSGPLLYARRGLRFPEREGIYWGPPADDRAAILELERIRREGATFFVLAWPAFWWLDHYTGLFSHLRQAGAPVLSNERILVFALGPGSPPQPPQTATG